mgnify:CR=1
MINLNGGLFTRRITDCYILHGQIAALIVHILNGAQADMHTDLSNIAICSMRLSYLLVCKLTK